MVNLELFGHPPLKHEAKKYKRKPTRPNGYAGNPGRGPQGETCRSCEHYVLKNSHSRVYRKCGLCEASWTHGPGSDILARSPACEYWEKCL
jgi:hypothetical protein